MIYEVKGDLTTIGYGIVAHQVNILGVAASGVVTDIRECLPGWYQEYKTMCKQFSDSKEALLGKVQFYNVPENSLFIANMFSQFSIKPFNRNTDLNAFKTCLTTVKEQAIQNGNIPVFIPKYIASVRGGMDWEVEVFPIIEELFNDQTSKLYMVDYVKNQQVQYEI